LLSVVANEEFVYKYQQDLMSSTVSIGKNPVFVHIADMKQTGRPTTKWHKS